MTKLSLSFELFPPRTSRSRELLWLNVGRLSTLNPNFMTVTYGAGGSTREWTIDTACNIQNDTGISMASHLTCIVTPKKDIEVLAHELWDKDIRRIVALRGDVPEGKTRPDPDDSDYYHYSSNFVEGLLKLHPFDISVAAYPEKHPDAPSMDADIEALKKKCDAGAARAITQLFFDNESFYDFMDKVLAAGIKTPIVPGILPIVNYTKAESFAGKCGARIPEKVMARFKGLDPVSKEAEAASLEIVKEQVRDLIRHGINSFHFYTLNQAGLTYTACSDLGLAL